ncbi:hypothetical protein M011DRAFT_407500 [Sporormia fimetaria CBS 119925]|uniref:Uncharacterized protein n=1 Tax=Sporormia fimetaria CBS 119925 TaxID=1340428 RepID=A0A6A6V5C9_9PLEO|nr:hypothetical protein M011DRAFT_407500 [Sporormia fimetaria CBS 119925]
MPPRKPAPKSKSAKSKLSGRNNTGNEAEIAYPASVTLQQALLNIFKDAFSMRFESDIQPLLQEVKGHLYNRDFLTAFGRSEYLEAYAARWSPSRALGYLQLLAQLEEIQPILATKEKPVKIVCLGGGAGAEVVALGGLLHFLHDTPEHVGKPNKFEVVAIDIADWSPVIDQLAKSVVSEPVLSKYASAAAKEANAPLLPSDDFIVAFHRHDVLNADFSDLGPLLDGASLTTIMFTLNELYSTSVSLTQKFLLNLTARLPTGALLLVVDSPGSYSTVSLNGTEKKYPMQWLLDHTLLRETRTGGAPWQKLAEEESKWFRLAASLRYPIELENMRFQLHLYRRTL